MSGLDRSRFVDTSETDLDEFTCAICQLVFVDPVETQCCQQIYCKACITQWLSSNNTCPNDRQALDVNRLRKPSRLVLNLLSKMKIRCEFHEKGCDFITRNELMDDHIKTCYKNPNNYCKNCKVSSGPGHDCIEYLVQRVKELEFGTNKSINAKSLSLSALTQYDTMGYLEKMNEYYGTLEQTLQFNLDEMKNFENINEEEIMFLANTLSFHIGSSKIIPVGMALFRKFIKGKQDCSGSVLKKILNLTINSMANHENHYQVQWEALQLIRTVLNTSKITEEDYQSLSLTTSLLNNIVNFDDYVIVVNSMAVSHFIMSKLSIREKAFLGSDHKYIETLLNMIVANQETIEESNLILNLSLGIIWSFTDENAEACNIFVSLGGIQIYDELLKKTQDMDEFERALLGALSNVVEVESLRHSLIDTYLVKMLRDYIESEHTRKSYQAIYIIVHLMISGIFTVKILKLVMERVILNWDPICEPFLSFRSYRVCWDLIEKSELDLAHLFSVWTIFNTCHDNENNLNLFKTENGIDKIKSLLNRTKSKHVKRICENICNLIK